MNMTDGDPIDGHDGDVVYNHVEGKDHQKSRNNHLQTCYDVAANLYESFHSDDILGFDLHPQLVGEYEEANIDEQSRDSCSIENSTNISLTAILMTLFGRVQLENLGKD